MDLKNVLAYCEKEKLFFGEGTPTAKILLIGKECGWNERMGTSESKEKIIEQAQTAAKHNLDC